MVAQHEFNIATDGEADIALGILIGDVAQLTYCVNIHLPLGAGTNGPDLIAIDRDMMQDTGTRPIMPIPVTVILLQ